MKKTFTYKNSTGCDIKGDFYPTDQTNAPLIVYIHGGGLIWGTREDVHAEQIALYNQYGFHFCSIDYRLAPESTLPDITSDIQDALIWLKETGKETFDYDPERIAVVGSSAGGYLALFAGTLSFKPKAIVSFYGYGNILGDWYTKPSPHFTNMTTVPKMLADQLIQPHPISGAPIERRYAIYLYCRQQGTWLDYVTNWNPFADTDKLHAYCPIEKVNVDYPATLLLHGDQDEDVPYEESVKMNKKIQDLGGSSQLITIPNGKHSFDQDMDNPLVKGAFKQVITFLKENL